MNDHVYEVVVCADCRTQLHHDADGNYEPCGSCGSHAEATVRVRATRETVLEQAQPFQSLVERTLYFGCWRRPGHYYFRRGMQNARRDDSITPWGYSVDGGLFPKGARIAQGEAAVFHRDGWTALAFPDRSVDSRPGSWSVFCIPETLPFDEALVCARAAFPEVFERLTFEIRPWQP